jgi:AraC-like DNA-binding protein
MRSASVISIVFLLSVSFSYSQKTETTAVLLKNAGEILYDDPSQALKIGTHLLHNPMTEEEAAQTYLLLSRCNLISGNYTQAISDIKLAIAKAVLTENSAIQFEAYLLAAEIYSYLHLFEISKPYYNEVEKLAKAEITFKKHLEAYQLFVTEDKKNPAYTEFVKNLNPKDEILYSFITKGNPQQITAQRFLKQSQSDSAAVYFRKSLRNINNLGGYWKMVLLNDYAAYFFAKKDYTKAIELLAESLEKGKNIGNAYFLMSINEKLSNCYLALGNKSKFQQYRQTSLSAGNDYDTQVSLATNFAFETLQKEKEETLEATEITQQNTCIFLGMLSLLIFLAWLFVKWLFATRIRHESDIISYLKLIKKSESPTANDKKYTIVEKTTGKISIPKETEAMLLAKLEKFETGKKYLNKEMSLAQMASLFETNTKYLSEIINKYKGKNINLYINELRIRYIVEKLKNDPKYLNYKVSYLAEECGFSSHSSFSAVFKNITGITPNVFIQFLSEDIHETNKTQLLIAEKI